jgi:hypothetical protein
MVAPQGLWNVELLKKMVAHDPERLPELRAKDPARRPVARRGSQCSEDRAAPDAMASTEVARPLVRDGAGIGVMGASAIAATCH